MIKGLWAMIALGLVGCEYQPPSTPAQALSAKEEALVQDYRAGVAIPADIPYSQELQRCLLGFASGELYSLGNDPASRWVRDVSICLDLQDELISNRRAMAQALQ